MTQHPENILFSSMTSLQTSIDDQPRKSQLQYDHMTQRMSMCNKDIKQ